MGMINVENKKNTTTTMGMEECGMEMSELKVAFVSMPTGQSCFFDTVYTAVKEGKNADEILDICGSSLEKSNMEVLMGLSKVLLLAEAADDKNKTIEEKLLEHTSATAVILPALVKCELYYRKEILTKDMLDALEEMTEKTAFEVYLQKQPDQQRDSLREAWQHMRIARYSLEIGEISKEEFDKLREIAQTTIATEVMEVMGSSQSKWRQLQEKYGEEEVEFVRKLLQG